MEDSYWNTLKGEIHEKCVFYDYIDQSDMSLAEFIINIIQMGKTPEEVSVELSSLIGDDYDQNMTQWIFLRLEELKNPQSSLENKYHQPNNNVNAEDRKFTATATIATNKETRQSVSTGRNRIFAQALDGLKPKQSRHEYSGGSYSRNSNNNNNHRYSSRSRSRSRSPDRNRERTSYRDRKDNNNNSNSNIQSRLGKKVNSAPSVFDRLGIQKPESVVDERSKQRCKYWPECDKGDDCVYVHPNTLCPEFPNCPKPTNECLFIHPETRPKKHSPTNPNLTQKAIPCRFFPYCTNDQCPYFHPPLPTYSQMPMATAITPTIKKIPVPCKNGDKCERLDCHFLHPNDTNPSEIICKFDGACTRPGCFYKHTVQSTSYPIGPTVNKTLIIQSNSPESKKYTNERVFAVAEDDQVEKMVVGESADIIKM